MGVTTALDFCQSAPASAARNPTSENKFRPTTLSFLLDVRLPAQKLINMLIKSATGKLAMSTLPEATADEERGTTMTLRKAHTTATNRVRQPSSRRPVSRHYMYDGASTSDKKKILATCVATGGYSHSQAVGMRIL